MKDDPSLRVEQSSEQNSAPEGDLVLVPEKNNGAY